MSANLHDHLTDQLFKAVLSLKDQEQCYRFFLRISVLLVSLKLWHNAWKWHVCLMRVVFMKP